MEGDWFYLVRGTRIKYRVEYFKGDDLCGRIFRSDGDGYDTVEMFHQYPRPDTFVTMGPDEMLKFRHEVDVGSAWWREPEWLFTKDSFGNDAHMVKFEGDRATFQVTSPEITYEFESEHVGHAQLHISFPVRDVPRADELLEGVHAHFAGMCARHLNKKVDWDVSVVLETEKPRPLGYFGLRLLTR
jgi:hypothetical protein